MENPSGKEKNAKKPNRCFEIYLEYVKMYNILKLDWTVQRNYPVEIKNIWQDMTRKLNGCGGPVRDVTHWKKVFTEWKSHTRKKLKCGKLLNHMEKQLVEVTSLTSSPQKKTATAKIARGKSKKNEQSLELKHNLLVIKQELFDSDDSVEEATANQEVIVSSNEDLTSPKKMRVIPKIPLEDQILRKSIQNSKMFKQLIPTASPINESDSNSANRQPLDIATQVDQSMLINGNESVSIGTGLLTLAKAVNRYCDILERRMF